VSDILFINIFIVSLSLFLICSYIASNTKTIVDGECLGNKNEINEVKKAKKIDLLKWQRKNAFLLGTILKQAALTKRGP
jgi:hypothetical protein